MAKFPNDLAKDSEPHDGILLRQMETSNQPPDALIGIDNAAAIEKTAFAQGHVQHFRDAFDFRSRG